MFICFVGDGMFKNTGVFSHWFSPLLCSCLVLLINSSTCELVFNLGVLNMHRSKGCQYCFPIGLVHHSLFKRYFQYSGVLDAILSASSHHMALCSVFSNCRMNVAMALPYVGTGRILLPFVQWGFSWFRWGWCVCVCLTTHNT